MSVFKVSPPSSGLAPLPVPQDIFQRHQKLQQDLRAHNHAYYVLDAPTISDAQYDALYAQLKAMESQWPQLTDQDSPSQKIGAPLTYSPLGKREHLFPLYSLDNGFSAQDMDVFIKRTWRFLQKKLTPEMLEALNGRLTWVAEPKIDGLSVVLGYRKGSLVYASTRGDGKTGEDISVNVATLPCIPKVLSVENGDAPWPEIMELRGEVYMNFADFEALNIQRAQNDLPLFSNPRNAAAGSVRHLDPEVTRQRALRFQLHGFSQAKNPGSESAGEARTYEAWMRRLQAAGMPYSQQASTITTADTGAPLEVYFTLMEEKRHQLPYPVDGIVYKLNDLSLQEVLGHSAKAPRYAIARKFIALSAHTTLQSIEIQVGRTGVLTPVAHLEPVMIAGVSVARASLHNASELARKDIRPGDVVEVARAGDVIPYVIRVVQAAISRGEAFTMPTTCPVCGHETVQPQGAVAYYCSGQWACPAQRLWRLRHFCGRYAFDISGLGPKHLKQLMENSLISAPQDLFSLTQEQLRVLPGWGDLSAQKVVTMIQERRGITLGRFLYALGIVHVGISVAQWLAGSFGSVAPLLSMEKEALTQRLEEIEGLGPRIAQEIAFFFQENVTRSMVLDLLRWVRIQDEVSEGGSIPTQGPLSGKTFVFTGALQGISREQAQMRTRQAGGAVSEAITRHVTHVVQGGDSSVVSSKIKAAGLRGVPVITQETWESWMM